MDRCSRVRLLVRFGCLVMTLLSLLVSLVVTSPTAVSGAFTLRVVVVTMFFRRRSCRLCVRVTFAIVSVLEVVVSLDVM